MAEDVRVASIHAISYQASKLGGRWSEHDLSRCRVMHTTRLSCSASFSHADSMLVQDEEAPIQQYCHYHKVAV